jgi:hypothetical protein
MLEKILYEINCFKNLNIVVFENLNFVLKNAQNNYVIEVYKEENKRFNE